MWIGLRLLLFSSAIRCFCMTDRMIIGRIFPVRRRVKRAIINGRLVYIIELPEEFNHIWRELYENNKEVVFYVVEEGKCDD